MARENKVVLIEAEDATIATVSVTIQTLQVSKRQMTQSVFRQLPVVPLVDEEKLVLLGKPWGWVNYLNDDQRKGGRHFIFQVEDRLFRSHFRIVASGEFLEPNTGRHPFEDLRPWVFRELYTRITDAVRARHYSVLLGGWRPDPCPKYHWEPDYKGLWNRYYEYEEFPSSITVDRYPCNPNHLGIIEGSRSALQPTVEIAEESLRQAIDKVMGWDADTESIEAEIAIIRGDASDFSRRWDSLMDQLRGVEQLFIAC